MAEPVQTPAVERSPPSEPASPPHKRTKVIEPVSNFSVASILNDDKAPTPTPSTISQPPPLPTADLPSMTAPAAPSLPSMTFDAPPALQIQLLSATAKPPTRGSAFAAGYDLYASKATTIPARGRVLVDTDISIAVPEGTYGRVAPRSGLAVKHGIDTGAGVIDADYRGPVKVLLFNLSETDFEVQGGDRIAQLIVERIYTPEVVVVEKLEESVRGAGGFGSTGGFGTALPPLNGV
ncbi:deoxyuridine 5'-triphosphate nucleotidohydrolase [Elsinoe australis]|uniref:Deoxyuridine 5'-triphosphate nucleotidohydrolase n=1 Tax=Elsinoe australis TaxID=40998 RepID=A0A2P8AJG8_9PEZI|nr:deoxyuridine 5'-triphosphate nucleotidohydrolase [Elsinoe australis]